MLSGSSSVAHGLIRSMTGFGRAFQLANNVEVSAEVRAVNHRFLDVSIRMPRSYNCFEAHVRKMVSEYVHRGKVDVSITRTGGKGDFMDVVLDQGLAESYHECLLELKSRLGLAGEITLSDMLTLKDIVTPVERVEGIDQEWGLVKESMSGALAEMDAMRRTEGAALWTDIGLRLVTISQTANLIDPLVYQVTEAVRERLERRVRELTGGMDLDPERLVQEVALMAERSDVSEELTRLQSHVDQFRSASQEGSPLGRKLDFLLQELQREINTIGSKSASTEIMAHVVTMKSEVEKIREQTQNIE